MLFDKFTVALCFDTLSSFLLAYTFVATTSYVLMARFINNELFVMVEIKFSSLTVGGIVHFLARCLESHSVT